MQPQEGNKLIAEFMGWTYYTKEYNWKRSRIDYPTWSDGAMGWKELHFHTSWDWLMPVVEKIEGVETIGQRCYVDISLYKISGYCSGVESKGLDVFRYTEEGRYFNDEDKRQAVWRTVVKIIQWYNKTKTNG
jgi:hypothetical protein